MSGFNENFAHKSLTEKVQKITKNENIIWSSSISETNTTNPKPKDTSSTIGDISRNKCSNSQIENKYKGKEEILAVEEQRPWFNDAGASTYALQIALQNMKERYHKVQKKIALLEEENTRLINGKTELFSEIGKMQENSIKLREKNLKLNHEFHSKHQECCSVKEQFTQLTKDNLELSSEVSMYTFENKRLGCKVNNLQNENAQMKNSILALLQFCNQNPSNVPQDLLLNLKKMAPHIHPVCVNVDKLTKTTIISSYDDMNYDDCEQAIITEDSIPSLEDFEAMTNRTLELATESLNLVASSLKEQAENLNNLSPFFQSIKNEPQEANYTSRLATCGSIRSGALCTFSGETNVSSFRYSKGESNVLVEGKIENTDRPKSPFDWRKVQVSDDESADNGRRNTRNVSTSPDPSINVGLNDDGDRTCPMCNAVFPNVVPQETFESHVVRHFEIQNVDDGS